MRAKHHSVSLLFCLAFGLAVYGALAADPAWRSFDLALSGGMVAADKRSLRVDKGDAVRLRVSSDAAGELHVHGYRVQAKVAPGTPAEIAFEAFASGRYRIEWHAAKDAAGASAKAAGHHGAPLATLDVLPR